MKNFKTILADPPWPFNDKLDKTRHKPYSTMTIEDLMSLPISSLTAEKAHLYLWTPNAFLEEALLLCKAWGFKYNNIIPWVKLTVTRKLWFGMGRDFRNCTELLIFGVKGKLRTLTRNTRNVIIAKRPLLHSQKPIEAYHLIEKNSPMPRLELFARECREGWTSIGYEIDGTDIKKIIRQMVNN